MFGVVIATGQRTTALDLIVAIQGTSLIIRNLPFVQFPPKADRGPLAAGPVQSRELAKLTLAKQWMLNNRTVFNNRCRAWYPRQRICHARTVTAIAIVQERTDEAGIQGA
jgi:hypothetical protein